MVTSVTVTLKKHAGAWHWRVRAGQQVWQGARATRDAARSAISERLIRLDYAARKAEATNATD